MINTLSSIVKQLGTKTKKQSPSSYLFFKSSVPSIVLFHPKLDLELLVLCHRDSPSVYPSIKPRVLVVLNFELYPTPSTNSHTTEDVDHCPPTDDPRHSRVHRSTGDRDYSVVGTPNQKTHHPSSHPELTHGGVHKLFPRDASLETPTPGPGLTEGL